MTPIWMVKMSKSNPFFKEEMATLERKLKRVQRDYVRAMRITKNVDWLGDTDVLNYKPVLSRGH